MKRTLKRELKVLEIVKKEAFGTSIDAWQNHVELVDKRCQGGAVSGVTWRCEAISKAVLLLRVGQHRLD
jgi:hypothetical protein